MKFNILLLFIVGIIILQSCKIDAPHNEETEIKNHIILLDLSDRILSEGQVERDKEIIKSIYNIFYNQVKNNMFIKSNDKFMVVIAEQKKSNVDKGVFENLLRINMNTYQMSQKKLSIDKFGELLDFRLDSLYETALSNGGQSDDYEGADIWKYFSEDIDSDLNADPLATNFLYIITDGYVYFENNNKEMKFGNRHSSCKFLEELRVNNYEDKFIKGDYGIIKVDNNFPRLNVKVIEIAPKDVGNLYEFPLLELVWSKWLTEMDVASFDKLSKNNTAIDKVKEKLKSFSGSTITVTPDTNIKQTLDKKSKKDSLIANVVDPQWLVGLYIGNLIIKEDKLVTFEIKEVHQEGNGDFNLIYSLRISDASIVSEGECSYNIETGIMTLSKISSASKELNNLIEKLSPANISKTLAGKFIISKEGVWNVKSL